MRLESERPLRVLYWAGWTVCLSEAQRRSITRIAPWIENRSSVIYCALEPPPVEPSPMTGDPEALAGAAPTPRPDRSPERSRGRG